MNPDSWYLLDGQFLVANGRIETPDDWDVYATAEFTLSVSRTLPVVPLIAHDDTEIGWFLGFPIDADGCLLTAQILFPVETSKDVDSSDIEEYLNRLGGRFVLVVLTERLQRLYMDPGGTLSVVYSERAACAASTNTTLVLATEKRARSRQPRLGELEPNQFYPAGLTADPDIYRVLPNHYLDLATWQTLRHRYREPLERVQASDMDPVVEIIAQCLGRQIRAVAATYPSYIGMTAGRDTRMLLAAGKDVLDRVKFVTFAYPDLDGRRDLSAARYFSKRYQLSLEVLPIQEPEDELKEQYLYRIGFAGHWGKSRDFYVSCKDNLKPNRAMLTGFGAEVGRAFYWKKFDWNAYVVNRTRRFDAGSLLEVMRLPRTGKFEEAMERWLLVLDDHDVPSLLDLLYLEQRLGCWASPHMYGAAPFAAYLSPYTHSEILSGMMQLPVAFRLNQGLTKAVLNFHWPELNGFRYQRELGLAGTLREYARSIRRRISR